MLQDGELYVVNKKNWNKLKKLEPSLNELIFETTLDSMYYIIDYAYNSICLDNTKRYDMALKRMPYLINVSDDDMADYLGTTRTSINKIKNNKYNQKK
jgi:hypothetical protein